MSENSGNLTVYYDGSCPLCRKEIRHYRKLKKADTVDWVDISSVPEGSLPRDLDKETAMKKFHVRTESGELDLRRQSLSHCLENCSVCKRTLKSAEQSVFRRNPGSDVQFVSDCAPAFTEMGGD